MKALKYIAIATLAITAGLTTSCKKGENDPFLSLSSRKARLTGEWTVSSSYSKNVSTGTSTVTNVNSYDGTTNTNTYTSGIINNTSTENYTIEMTINRDGSYSKITTNTTDEEKYEESGIWTFAGKDKTSDYKKKEVVVFYPRKTIYTDLSNTSNTSTQETSSVNYGETYVIDQLKGKEIIFKSNSSYTSNTGSNTSESTMTLTKK
jgi:hypothetical protein